jgi:ribosomal protein S18 acetylase RimI-like enzyme
MGIEIRPFSAADYARARSLWEATEGVGLSAADDEGAILGFLDRNPGLSFVGMDGERLAGTILVGHDGRRGLIHHLAVAGAYRRQGLGNLLVGEGLAALRRAGIHKCHLLVFAENTGGRAFWEAVGAEHRESLTSYSLDV